MTSELATDFAVRLTGSLDANMGRALWAEIVALPEGVGFVLDVSEAHHVDDSALALLARDLARSNRVYVLRGLSQHHERLLRYLGIEWYRFND